MKLLKCPTVTSSWYKKLDNTSIGYQGKNFEGVPCVAKHAQSTDSLKMQIKISELFMQMQPKWTSENSA